MKNSFLNKIFNIVLCVGLVTAYAPRLSADENTTEPSDTIDLVAGDVQPVPVNGLIRISVTNPEVADIADAQSDKVSLLAKRAGETILFLWDASGKRSIKIRVVKEDLTAVKSRVQKVLGEARITGVELEENIEVGKVVLTGSLSKDDKSRLEDVVQPYSENLLNLVKVEKNEDLIQVDMQVVEISTTLESQLGIQWGAATVGSSGSSSNTVNGSNNTNSGTVLLNYNETLPSSNGHISDFFKIGNFKRTNPLEATVNAMIQEGKAKLISKPRLVVVSGKQASFLVGGEIPINTTTTNTSGTTLTQNTSYTQYGVNMTVTPTIREGKIDVLLNVDIRDIDGSTPISSSGNSNVAFITRTASTDLFMDNKQTIVLAGLIKYSDSLINTKVPILGNIPLLGALFRYKQIPNNSNTEMVIILTPTVLTSKNISNSQIAMPTAEIRKNYREFETKYDHEMIASAWPAAKPTARAIPKDAAEEMTDYARMVQMKISSAIKSPQDLSLAGTVKLKLRILKDGSLDSEEVVNSSGNDTLDQAALQAAKTAAPYDAFTTGMDQQDMLFTIPIVYNKLMVGGQAPADKVIAAY